MVGKLSQTWVTNRRYNVHIANVKNSTAVGRIIKSRSNGPLPTFLKCAMAYIF